MLSLVDRIKRVELIGSENRMMVPETEGYVAIMRV